MIAAQPLVFASHNAHKVQEINAKLGTSMLVKGLHEIGCTEEIPETADTLEGNARIKAWHVYNQYGHNCFADDTGLEVVALNNAPGVRSARYAGEHKSFEDNMNLLLENMKHETNREARFRTVICLVLHGKEYVFDGVVNGHIAREKRGLRGFGYDPVFVPAVTSATFAEMDMDEKNLISHRAKAVQLLAEFLQINF
ncbi:MAG: RdgB/HAM1 family non-canonical purine NTP pyrophosphatase [Flavobacteriales bacterium]